MNLPYIFSILLLVFGFGFVIFWHELGHFLAAKWVGIKVEQFAVGFGQAILAWRKGIGLRIGTTQREYDKRLKDYVETQEAHLALKDRATWTQEQLAHAAQALGLGETEYRLNWIPLGGYVKMLGQDDLNPNSQSDDPRAFNRKSIPARMLVVSAGVIMNVILAAIGFMVVFMIGFSVPPAMVGGIIPNSPAQVAGLRTGDEIWTYDGKRQYDWTKVQLNVALSGEGETVPIEVKRKTSDGGTELVKLMITPRREAGDPRGFLSLGLMNPRALRGVSEKEQLTDDREKLAELYPADMLALMPGDVITAVNGRPVDPERDLAAFDAALQSSGGSPVRLTVKDKAGAVREVSVQPHFVEPFGADGFNLAGLVPRTAVHSITETSDARGKLKPGDVITAVVIGSDALPHPTRKALVEWLNKAGQNGNTVDLHVLRDGAEVVVEKLNPSLRVDRQRRGLGIMLGFDEASAVVADVLPSGAAAEAGVTGGATITAIDGKPVQTWYDVHRQLSAAAADRAIPIAYRTKSGEQKQATLTLKPQQLADVQNARYAHSLYLGESRVPRKAANALQAMGWGVTETRDFILQFYVTLRRMIDGTVSPSNLMGPIGIFHAGTKFAYKGHDWLIWFLSMISANLAVVNFLPIPIVDGGLFTFLVLEKIKGRPLSARTQTIAQFVGMAVLLCVFLLVTYQDIARLTFMR
jgi:regulator of sigma E protease